MSNKIKRYVENSWSTVYTKSIFEFFEAGLFSKDDMIEYIEFLREELLKTQKECLKKEENNSSSWEDFHSSFADSKFRD